MAAVSQIIRPSRIAAAVWTLKNLSIPVHGPFVTPRELWLYVVDDCIVSRAELLALYDGGKLTSENVAAVLSGFKLLQTTYVLATPS